MTVSIIDPESTVPDLAAILLAAGFSRRFGKKNKLHAALSSNRLVVEKVIETVATFPFRRIIVVTAPGDQLTVDMANQRSVETVVQPNPEFGMGSSLAMGVSAVGETCADGVAVFLGDMPFLKPRTIQLLASSFFENGMSRVIRPNYNEMKGHPVLFPQKLFGELMTLAGDKGAMQVVRKHGCVSISVDDEGVVRDVDTPEDLSY